MFRRRFSSFFGLDSLLACMYRRISSEYPSRTSLQISRIHHEQCVVYQLCVLHVYSDAQLHLNSRSPLGSHWLPPPSTRLQTQTLNLSKHGIYLICFSSHRDQCPALLDVLCLENNFHIYCPFFCLFRVEKVNTVLVNNDLLEVEFFQQIYLITEVKPKPK